MGVIAGLGRTVLIIVNTVTFLVAVGILACGAVIKYVLGDILKSDVISIIGKAVFALFIQNTAVPSSIDFGPLTDGIGVALFVVGTVLAILSLLGCIAGCCKFRLLLVTFAVCVGLLVLAQIIVFAVFLPRDSAIHDDAKKALNESLNKEYNRVNINSFTISSDVVFLAAECCGVYGARDLFNHPNMRFNASGRLIRSPTFPPSCCKREYINKLDWTCCEDTTFDKVYTRGCYETIQDVVEGWYPWLIPTIVLSLAVQVGEIVVAALVCCDSDNFVV